MINMVAIVMTSSTKWQSLQKIPQWISEGKLLDIECLTMNTFSLKNFAK